MNELIFLIAFPAVVVCGSFLAIQFPRVRDLLLVSTLFSTAMVYLLDINFLGRPWYRGTSLGMEFSFLDAMVLTLIITSFATHTRYRTPWFLPPALAWMLIYFAFCVLNVLTHDPKVFGAWELSKIFRGILAFTSVCYAIRNSDDLKLFTYGICAAIYFEGSMAIADRYLNGTFRVSGSFDHPNGLSLFCCMATPLLLAAGSSRTTRSLQYCCWGAVPFAVLAVILTVSRTGFVVIFATSAVTLAIVSGFKISPRRVALAFLILVASCGILFKSWDTVMERFAGVSLEEEFAAGQGDQKYQGRGMYFELAEAIVADRPWGVGLNNWSYYVSDYYGPMLGYEYRGYEGTEIAPDRTPMPGSNLMQGQAAPAHNLYLLTAGELGWAGLAIFVVLWFMWLRMSIPFFLHRNESIMNRFAIGVTIGLLAAMLQCLTEWIFRYAPVFFMCHFYAGALSRLYYHQRQLLRRAS
ncbi:MAG: O-antigen ligase family protein [Candidatus Hydrogenedentes bacterium]|nr:O-antigen ligase family protein [Candidatus Hydrogenedentota bacterium]